METPPANSMANNQSGQAWISIDEVDGQIHRGADGTRIEGSIPIAVQE